MAWIRYNPNPANKETVDCVVRAISIAEGISWDEAFKALTDKAYDEKDMPSYNPTWANYLRDNGYILFGLPNTCPRCYTVADFANDHPKGTFVLGTGSHAIAVIDGNYIDTWNSGSEVPMYFFKKGDKANEQLRRSDTRKSADNSSDNATSAESTTNAITSVVGTGIGRSQSMSVDSP